MVRYSVDGVERIGTMETLGDADAREFVARAFEGRNGSAMKRERGDTPIFWTVWRQLNHVSHPQEEVRRTLFENLDQGRTTLLGFNEPEETIAYVNTLRQQAKETGLGPLVVRGVADQKGGIGVGIVRSLVAIRLARDGR